VIRNNIIVATAIGLFATSSVQAYTDAELTSQLERLMSMWPGEYDNNEQIVRQSGGGLSEPVYTPHFRIHSHFMAVELPALGKHVLYIEEYKNNDPKELYRIRLLALVVSPADNGITGTLHSFEDQDALVGAHSNPALLTERVVAETRKFSKNCELVIHYENGQFIGGMQPKRCRISTREGSAEKDGYFDYKFVIGPDGYWFHDAIRRLSDDSMTWRLAGDSDDFFMLDRARWFACDVNFNAQGDMTATERLGTVELHDQGGVTAVNYPGRPNLSLVLHNREFQPGSADRFRILRLHENDNPVPLAYGYSIVPTERFGFNLGWFYTLCRPK